MIAIVDKQPKTLTLMEMMKYFISHRQDVIRRRTRFDLKKAEARGHILEGLMIALDHLDAIIKLIRASKSVEEARKGLVERFKLSPIQAQAILEMQLQRLTQLERQKVVNEYEEIKTLIAKLKKILASDKLVLDIIVEELKQIKADYGDERRTEIRDEVVSDLRPEDLIKEEDVAVVYTSSGYIKRTSLTSYHFQSRGGKGRRGIEMKAEDIVEHLFIGSTHSYLLVFTNLGRLYWLKALEVPDVGPAGRGKAIANLIEFAPGRARLLDPRPSRNSARTSTIIMLTTNGLIKKTRLSEFKNVRKGGILAMTIQPKSELFTAELTSGKQRRHHRHEARPGHPVQGERRPVRWAARRPGSRPSG